MCSLFPWFWFLVDWLHFIWSFSNLMIWELIYYFSSSSGYLYFSSKNIQSYFFLSIFKVNKCLYPLSNKNITLACFYFSSCCAISLPSHCSKLPCWDHLAFYLEFLLFLLSPCLFRQLWILLISLSLNLSHPTHTVFF